MPDSLATSAQPYGNLLRCQWLKVREITLSLSLSLSLFISSISLSLSLYIHTYNFLSFSLSLSLPCSLTLSHFFSHNHSQILSLSLSLSLARSIGLSLSLSFSLQSHYFLIAGVPQALQPTEWQCHSKVEEHRAPGCGGRARAYARCASAAAAGFCPSPLTPIPRARSPQCKHCAALRAAAAQGAPHPPHLPRRQPIMITNHDDESRISPPVPPVRWARAASRVPGRPGRGHGPWVFD